MHRLDYVVARGEAGWLVTANHIDCGVVADRETALAKALLWARENGEVHGCHVRVLVDDGTGPSLQREWGERLPALRLAAAAMRRPSAYFVRELAEFRPLYISA